MFVAVPHVVVRERPAGVELWRAVLGDPDARRCVTEYIAARPNSMLVAQPYKDQVELKRSRDLPDVHTYLKHGAAML